MCPEPLHKMPEWECLSWTVLFARSLPFLPFSPFQLAGINASFACFIFSSRSFSQAAIISSLRASRYFARIIKSVENPETQERIFLRRERHVSVSTSQYWRQTNSYRRIDAKTLITYLHGAGLAVWITWYLVIEGGILQGWMFHEPDLHHDKLRVARPRKIRVVRAAIRILLSWYGRGVGRGFLVHGEFQKTEQGNFSLKNREKGNTWS